MADRRIPQALPASPEKASPAGNAPVDFDALRRQLERSVAPAPCEKARAGKRSCRVVGVLWTRAENGCLLGQGSLGTAANQNLRGGRSYP